MNHVQFLEQKGKPQWAIVPYEFYLQLTQAAELQADHDFLAVLDTATNKEFIPAAVVDRIIEGNNLIRVWREYRGLTQPQLARLAQVSQSTLSQLESGKRRATKKTLEALATALKLEVADLVREEI